MKRTTAFREFRNHLHHYWCCFAVSSRFIEAEILKKDEGRHDIPPIDTQKKLKMFF
jgi:hypothetical protein